MLRLALAVLHLLALGLGLGAVVARGTALRDATRESASAPAALRRAFRADTMWGLSALLWISTGLWRLLAGTEKATSYYMQSHIFWTKMALLAIVLALEVAPAIALVRARSALARGAPADQALAPATARRIATVSHVEATLVTLMVVAAAAMARGLGAGH
jgi:putative membrane protein